MIRILFVGDVMGRPGRRALRSALPRLQRERRIDFTVVNIENSAGGFGVNRSVMEEFDALSIDCFTTGNHVWDKKEVLPMLDERDNLLRPANYPKGNPGKGVFVGESPAGIPVAVLNLEGQVFMKSLDSPFEEADRLIKSLPNDVKVIFVDFHAEATSEKQAMGFYLDGRVSAVVGTHTHVPTADARVLSEGTGLQTDVGMTGPYDSIIGMRVDKVLQRFKLQRNAPFEVAKRDVRLAAVQIDVDEQTGQCERMEPILMEVAL